MNYREGALSVLITSVHGFTHLREGSAKPADTGTRELSLLLALASDAHWLAVGRENELDSNHHKNTYFKQALAERIDALKPNLVLDVHASHAGRPFDVDIGSLRGASWLTEAWLAPRLMDVLQACGMYVTDNAVFRAEGSTPTAQTVTAYVAQELRTPAVQLEISSALCADLASRQALHQHAKLVNALANFVRLAATAAPY